MKTLFRNSKALMALSFLALTSAGSMASADTYAPSIPTQPPAGLGGLMVIDPLRVSSQQQTGRGTVVVVPCRAESLEEIRPGSCNMDFNRDLRGTTNRMMPLEPGHYLVKFAGVYFPELVTVEPNKIAKLKLAVITIPKFAPEMDAELLVGDSAEAIHMWALAEWSQAKRANEPVLKVSFDEPISNGLEGPTLQEVCSERSFESYRNRTEKILGHRYTTKKTTRNDVRLVDSLSRSYCAALLSQDFAAFKALWRVENDQVIAPSLDFGGSTLGEFHVVHEVKFGSRYQQPVKRQVYTLLYPGDRAVVVPGLYKMKYTDRGVHYTSEEFRAVAAMK